MTEKKDQASSPRPKKKEAKGKDQKKKAENRKLEAQHEEGGSKPSVFEICQNVAMSIANPKRAHLYGCDEPLAVHPLLMKMKDYHSCLMYVNPETKEVVFTKEQDFKREIIRHGLKNNIQIDGPRAQRVIDLWSGMIDPVSEEDVKLLAFHDDKSFCFKRLESFIDIDMVDTPIFDEFLSRVKGKDEFMAFIGSVFDEESDRSQYCWMYGEGEASKGSVLDALQNYLGSAYQASLIPNANTERWYTATILGKRLITFSDFENTTWVKRDFFKALTGDDYHYVEKKGVDGYNAKIIGKFLFMSNKKPAISNNRAELRRNIFCEVEPYNGPEIGKKELQRRLNKEVHAFVYKCMKAYEPHRGRRIKISSQVEELRRDLIADGEEIYAAVFDQNFHADENAKTKASMVAKILKEQGIRYSHDVSNFKQYCTDHHDIRVKRTKEGNMYFGMGLGMRPSGSRSGASEDVKTEVRNDF